MAAGATIALGADDPLLFGSRLAGQYATMRAAHDLTDAQLADLARSSFRASRAPEDGQASAGWARSTSGWGQWRHEHLPGREPAAAAGGRAARRDEPTRGRSADQPRTRGPAASTEPTQPVGYWERQAAEQSPAGVATAALRAEPATAQQPAQQPLRAAAAPAAATRQPAPTASPTTAQPALRAAAAARTATRHRPARTARRTARLPAVRASRRRARPPAGDPGAGPGHRRARLRRSCCGLGFLVSPFAWALGRNAAEGDPGLAGPARRGGHGAGRHGHRHHRHRAAGPGVLALIGFVASLVARSRPTAAASSSTSRASSRPARAR